MTHNVGCQRDSCTNHCKASGDRVDKSVPRQCTHARRPLTLESIITRLKPYYTLFFKQVASGKKTSSRKIGITLVYSFQRVYHLSYETRGGREAKLM